MVFSESGIATSRFGVLLDNLLNELQLPDHGKVLDVGCGNGNLLQQFLLRRPEWDLYGHEQAIREADFSGLSGVREVFSCDLGQIDFKFDLILMTHVIEHLVEPIPALKKIKKLLALGGKALIQTVSYQKNPFDLITCDHCSHFSPDLLAAAIVRSGLLPVVSTEGWVAKEIGYIAEVGQTSQRRIDVKYQLDMFNSVLLWLDDFVRKIRLIDSSAEIGVFGTANAGSWLAGVLGEKISFFVEEDSKRWGHSHLGSPIIAPSEIPDGAIVVMGFSTDVANKIVKRLSPSLPNVEFIIP
ncbi:class I SAM-dependent methyltransferase [Maridesulfovibrio sp. FT414]|uniref:class I SAM-dependent methyltransferase n=1 Tax=Maridesulfovibrio sp. FT414 TaxID=2979469 RepID=UPI003D803A6A